MNLDQPTADPHFHLESVLGMVKETPARRTGARY